MDDTTFDADHAHRFLTYVYAGQPGYLQIVDSGRGFFGEAFATDPAGISAAVDYARKRDADQPQGIYFRATTMRTQHPVKLDRSPGRGGADDTLSVPMMWGDVDHGEDGHKKGEALPPTREDGLTVITECGIPAPGVLVHSGGGWYPLWTLTGITVDEARELAVRVQALLLVASQRHGWAYGTGVSDLARVLRLPGSVNRKIPGTPRPCRAVGGTGAPITPSAVPTPDPVALERVTGPTRVVLPARRDYVPGARRGPMDVLDETTTWADILEPAGWSFVATEQGGSERWLRPGDASSEYSARAFEHNIVCHSESAGLPSGKDQRLTRGRVYAWLWHGGDESEAARDLVRVANNGGALTGSVPAATLDAIRELSGPRVLPAGFVYGKPTPEQFMRGETPIVPAPVADVPAATVLPPHTATGEELAYFLANYTRYARPDRLGRRLAWMRAEPAHRLMHHAGRLVVDALDGHYPADRALDALAAAYLHHGGPDPDGPRTILRVALGAVLNVKASA